MHVFARLPNELLHNIAYALVAQQPLGPPRELLPLLLLSKSLNLVFSANALKARIFRLKFDGRAVERRCFRPYNVDCAEQLVHACLLLRAIRTGDVNHADTIDHLFTAYILMLDNDGKNYAQMECAGIDRYVNAFVRQRLWEGNLTESNEGWPLDTPENACALWLMWMTVNRDNLVAETPEDREKMVILILPFVVLPQRYAAAEAPPNHFHLPLSPQNPLHQPPLLYSSADRPDAHYPHYLPTTRTQSQVHFRARPQISPPLITVAAKLLFVARREVFPIRVPPQCPPGLTPADYAELNKGKAAELPRGARWDWDVGMPRAVNPRADDCLVDYEESKKWDVEWWRRVLCWDIMAPRPRFTPGLVFTPGCMRGVWQGRIYIPQGNLFNRLFHQPVYPGIGDESGLFSESSLGLIMQPVFFNIEEHHRICGCPSSAHLTSCDASAGGSVRHESRSPASPSSLPTATTLVEADGCGIIPVPSPQRVTRGRAVDALDEQDFGVNIDELGNALAADPSHPDMAENDALKTGLPFPDRIDFSMNNAWFPGDLGGVSFVKRKVLDPNGNQTRRDEVVFAMDSQRPNVHEKGGCTVSDSPSTSISTTPRKSYVYETYDPSRASSHNPAKCRRCAEWDAARKEERFRASAEVALEVHMRDFARRSGRVAETNEKEEMKTLDMDDFEFDLGALARSVGQDEDEEMQSARAESDVEIDSDSDEGEDDDDDTPQRVEIMGDDQPYGQPSLYAPDGTLISEATRRVFDRERVGVACGCGGGVRDIVLTGEIDPRHAVWQQEKYIMYGRVRPWDGLIGILRVGHAPSTNFLFVCGYLVGENNFVGEWRVAAADPLRPAWGSAFVMSRRREETQA